MKLLFFIIINYSLAFWSDFGYKTERSVAQKSMFILRIIVHKTSEVSHKN